MLQFNQKVIGPQSIFTQPLDIYKNLDIDNTECNDDFASKMCSQTNNSLEETPNNRSNYYGQNKKYDKKKVKFNLNIVHCQFNQREPAISIGRLVQKLIHQKPHLNWVNPQVLHNQ